MYSPTTLLALLAALTPLALAQTKCQVFVTGEKETSVISSNPAFLEMTRSCAVSPQSKLGGNSKDCATLGFISSLDFKNSMFVRKDKSGLTDDVEIRIFRDDLTQGFVKTKNTDLNFQGGCDQVDGDNGDISAVRCEFDCPQ